MSKMAFWGYVLSGFSEWQEVLSPVLSNVGRFGHGRFSLGRCGHASLDVLATEIIQGGRFDYMKFLWFT